MYRHCIYCSAGLGTNEAIEAFPVGRTVAVDGEKGRLWAVCSKCARWNLAPIEERWEAVEAAEKQFADARMRVQGESIGLAQLRDGTRLIRIGRAEGRELAAWRYGDELRRRERVRVLGARLGMVANLGLVAVSLTGAVIAAPASLAWHLGPVALRAIDGRRVVHRVANGGERGEPRVIRRRDLTGAWVNYDAQGLKLALPAASPDRRHLLQLRGDDARRVVERAMVLVNRATVRSRHVDAAVGALSAAAGPHAFLLSVVGKGRVLTRGNTDGMIAQKMGEDLESALRGPEALAFEMALHEETERRALHGELALLEAAWREAEEIAAIADKLALAPGAKG